MGKNARLIVPCCVLTKTGESGRNRVKDRERDKGRKQDEESLNCRDHHDRSFECWAAFCKGAMCSLVHKAVLRVQLFWLKKGGGSARSVRVLLWEDPVGILIGSAIIPNHLSSPLFCCLFIPSLLALVCFSSTPLPPHSSKLSILSFLHPQIIFHPHLPLFLSSIHFSSSFSHFLPLCHPLNPHSFPLLSSFFSLVRFRKVWDDSKEETELYNKRKYCRQAANRPHV